METKKRLLMNFMSELDRKVSIAVDDPREDIAEDEIKEVMDLIVEKNIFAPYGCDLVSTVDAKKGVTDTTEFDLVL